MRWQSASFRRITRAVAAVAVGGEHVYGTCHRQVSPASDRGLISNPLQGQLCKHALVSLSPSRPVLALSVGRDGRGSRPPGRNLSHRWRSDSQSSLGGRRTLTEIYVLLASSARRAPYSRRGYCWRRTAPRRRLWP